MLPTNHRCPHRHDRLPLTLCLLALLAGVILASCAQAAPIWPANDMWRPLYRLGGFITDADNDFPGANGQASLDIEGNATYAAGYIYIDNAGTPTDSSDDYLMFRMRLDGTRANPNGVYQILIDADGNPATVDYVLQTDMAADDMVELLATTSGGPTFGGVAMNAVSWQGDLATYAHVLTPATDGSNFGGNPDYFVDVAIPWQQWEVITGLSQQDAFAIALSASTQDTLINRDYPLNYTSGTQVSLGFGDPMRPPVPEPRTLLLVGVPLALLYLRLRVGGPSRPLRRG